MKISFTGGELPHTLENNVGLENAFQEIARNLIKNTCAILLEAYPTKDFPYQEVINSEERDILQISIDASSFFKESIALRKENDYYSIIATSEGDTNGEFNYRFSDDDHMVNHIHPDVRQFLDDKYSVLFE